MSFISECPVLPAHSEHQEPNPHRQSPEHYNSDRQGIQEGKRNGNFLEYQKPT